MWEHNVLSSVAMRLDSRSVLNISTVSFNLVLITVRVARLLNSSSNPALALQRTIATSVVFLVKMTLNVSALTSAAIPTVVANSASLHATSHVIKEFKILG